MAKLQSIWGFVWRAGVAGAGYAVSMELVLVAVRGLQPRALAMELLAGVLVALLLGALARRLPASRARHLVVWGSVLFFNGISVIIEGAFFAPALVSGAAVIFLAARCLVSSLVAAGLIALLFAPRAVLPGRSAPPRAWYAWLWRFAASVASYLLFYFVFGAANYAWITQPYYTTHAGGLTVPPPEVVLMAELVRAPLMVLALLPFVRSMPARRRPLAGMTGLVAFVIGGIIPLLSMVGTLPIFLIVASGVEIFFQNFLTGVVCALLLGPRPLAEATANLVPAGADQVTARFIPTVSSLPLSDLAK